MILLTGASGFIGKYVLDELLRNGEEVVCIVRNPEKYHKIGKEIVIKADLMESLSLENELQKYKISTCIHLAWVGMPDYSFDNSMRSFEQSVRLLQLCKNLGAKHVIMTGTCFEYDKPKGSICTDYKIGDTDYYKVSKNALREMAGLFCKENDMRFNWLRLFYVYGNGQRETSLIPSVIRALENNQQPSIRNYKNRNDFVYVSDVAKAIYSILQRKPKTEILNVGSGYSLSVSDVIRTVAEVLNKNISFEEKQENEIVDFYADPDEMMKAYDWKPSYSLKEALEEMINEGSTVSRW